MDSFKIRFFDILRYFILGALEVLLINYLVDDAILCGLLGTDILSLSSPFTIAVLCICIYFLGFITQSVIQLFFGGDFLGSGIGEIAEYIRFYPTLWPNNLGYPEWLYWSDHPRLVLDVYKDILETEGNSDTKTEFLYSNQLFQGVAFAILTILCWGFLDSFEAVGTTAKLALTGSLICALWLIHWKCGHGRNSVLPIGLGIVMTVPICFMSWALTGMLSVGIVTSLCFLLSLLFAASLARKQIRRIDILANYNSDSSQKFKGILSHFGVPKMYILIRTNTDEFIEEALQSIRMQTYPNIKVLILIDSKTDAEKKNNIHRKIDTYSDSSYSSNALNRRINIQVYESSHHGPAALAYEIRQIFLNYANKDDVAMILDSDDKLYSPSTIAQIMTKIYRTGSNVCLIRFELFGKQNLNYSKNHHNELVKELCYEGSIQRLDKNTRATADSNTNEGNKSERRKAIVPEVLAEANELYRVSTIGWTKCYKKGVLERYHEIVSRNLLSHDILKYLEGKKYEDFPDILALLFRDTRICSVAKNSVLFRKSGNSVTTSISEDNYDVQIPFFLKFAKELVENNEEHLIDGGKDVVVRKLIPYKFVQYLNVVYKKTKGDPSELDEKLSGYSCDKFYKSFIRLVFGIEALNKENKQVLISFHKDVETIIEDDYEIFGDFPSMIKVGSAWDDICKAYDIEAL